MWPAGQSTVDIIRTIVLTQLNNSLPKFTFDDRIVIYNQEYVLPPVDGLWVEIAFVASKPFGSQNYTQTVDGVFQEVQDIYQQENIMVRLFSKNIEALLYKELVLMGLSSIFAQQQQEQYSFKISNVIPYPDTSDLEGGAINYRADISIMCLVAYENIITAGYLNNFETQVTNQVGMTEEFNPAILP